MSTDPTLCAGCGRPTNTPVCDRCQTRATTHLAELAERQPQLLLAQIPGGTSRNERVRHTKADAAPLPLRLDAFNLLAAGTLDDIDPLHAGDQSGVLPLDLWLTAWWSDWRSHLDLPRAVVRASQTPARASGALTRWLLTAGGKMVVDHETVNVTNSRGEPVVDKDTGEAQTRTRRILQPLTDTLDAEYAARYGRPDHAVTTATLHALTTNLPRACNEHPAIGDFLVGLRAMVGACRAVVGEASDLVHLGRCPELRRDKQTGVEEVCGGAIWQDPYVKLINCPRCRREWKEREWLWLGRRIRDAWPEPTSLHEFGAELVVIEPDPKLGLLGDRYWLTSCSCGTMPLEDRIVHGNRIDARGVWRRHVRALMPAESERLSA